MPPRNRELGLAMLSPLPSESLARHLEGEAEDGELKAWSCMLRSLSDSQHVISQIRGLMLRSMNKVAPLHDRNGLIKHGPC